MGGRCRGVGDTEENGNSPVMSSSFKRHVSLVKKVYRTRKKVERGDVWSKREGERREREKEEREERRWR